MTPGAGRTGGVLAALVAATLAALVLAIAVGPVLVSPPDVVRVLVGTTPVDPAAPVLIGAVRIPRAITAALAGAALGVAGLQLQTLFRNPLAEPFVLGVSAGASLGVALAVAGAAGGAAGVFASGLSVAGRAGTVGAAALGAATVMGAVLVLAHWARSGVTLLIVGVMIGSLTSAAVNLILTLIDPLRAQQFVIWGLGSFSATSAADLWILIPVIVAGLAVALTGVKPLNALLVSEDYARSLGVRVRRTRLLVLISSSLLAGTVTAFCGPVAFLGMAVPHLARLAVGTSDHRVLMPTALLTGATVALVCSVVANLPGSSPLPVNVITSVVGAPVVIAVLLRSRRLAAGSVS